MFFKTAPMFKFSDCYWNSGRRSLNLKNVIVYKFFVKKTK